MYIQGLDNETITLAKIVLEDSHLYMCSLVEQSVKVELAEK